MRALHGEQHRGDRPGIWHTLTPGVKEQWGGGPRAEGQVSTSPIRQELEYRPKNGDLWDEVAQLVCQDFAHLDGSAIRFIAEVDETCLLYTSPSPRDS